MTPPPRARSHAPSRLADRPDAPASAPHNDALNASRATPAAAANALRTIASAGAPPPQSAARRAVAGAAFGLAAASLAAACGHDDGEQHDHRADATDAHVDTPAIDPAVTPAVGVPVPTDSAAFLVTLVDTDPAPLDTGNTSLRFRVMYPDEEPVANADVRLRGWMPAHGHGTNPAERTATADGDVSDGVWTASPINLFMPGTWELTVSVDDGAQRDSVTFTVRLRP